MSYVTMTARVRALRSAGHWKTFSPDVAPADAKVPVGSRPSSSAIMRDQCLSINPSTTFLNSDGFSIPSACEVGSVAFSLLLKQGSILLNIKAKNGRDLSPPKSNTGVFIFSKSLQVTVVFAMAEHSLLVTLVPKLTFICCRS